MNVMTGSEASLMWQRPDGTPPSVPRPWDRGPGPVRFDEQTESWVVNGYEAAREILLGDGWSSDPSAADASRRALRAAGIEDAPLAQTMLTLDAPDHGRVRGSLRDVFTPHCVAAMGEGVEAIAAGVISGVAAGEPFDLMSLIAEPLPIAVIAEWMALEPDVAQLLWDETSELVGALEGTVLPTEALPSISGLTALFAEFLSAASERRRHPEDDLLSLLATEPELELDEVVSNAILLAVAGHETTAKLLGTSMIRLCSGEPGERLIDTLGDVGADGVIDELLRLDGTAQVVVRAATEQHEIAGRTIEAGARVIVAIAAANRDPAVFEAPHEFRPDRERDRPHLALGYGRHRCLGAALSRLELRIALRQIKARQPRLAGPVTWHPSGILRGPTRAPMIFTDGGDR
ncbi:cytochrome P450 [Williamsia sp.]|uniref:cytochrome P450 n=1 Tax=Williamsia sp. TaxID=1872085 RepID=UPI002F947405